MVQGHGLQATGRPEPAQVRQLLARAAVLVGPQGDLDNVVVVIVPETQAIGQEAHCARAGRERDSNRGVRGRRWGDVENLFTGPRERAGEGDDRVGCLLLLCDQRLFDLGIRGGFQPAAQGGDAAEGLRPGAGGAQRGHGVVVTRLRIDGVVHVAGRGRLVVGDQHVQLAGIVAAPDPVAAHGACGRGPVERDVVGRRAQRQSGRPGRDTGC